MSLGRVVARCLDLVLIDELSSRGVGGETDTVVGCAIETIFDCVQQGTVDRNSGGGGVVGVDIGVYTGDDKAGRKGFEGKRVPVNEG